MKSSYVQIAVVGAGAMGHLHFKYLADRRVLGARIAGLVDVDVNTAQPLTEVHGVQNAYTSLTGLLRSPTVVDAVVIATPRRTHAALALEAIAAGKHVFCEKPLAATIEEIDNVIAAVDKAGLVLQVGFQRRFDASFREVRDAITAGKIGEPRIIHSISRDPVWDGSASRTPEDLLLETTIHDIDMVRHLSGSEIEGIHALGLPATEAGRLEGAIITLRLANSLVATIDNHVGSAYGYDQRVEVFGSAGMVSVANLPTHAATLVAESGATSASPLDFFRDRYASAYIAELVAFAQSIANGTPPQVTGADGRAAVVVALAALDSLREGRPVSLA